VLAGDRVVFPRSPRFLVAARRFCLIERMGASETLRVDRPDQRNICLNKCRFSSEIELLLRSLPE